MFLLGLVLNQEQKQCLPEKTFQKVAAEITIREQQGEDGTKRGDWELFIKTLLPTWIVP